MNNLLYYLDMFSFRESVMVMTGLAYIAIRFGYVPVR